MAIRYDGTNDSGIGFGKLSKSDATYRGSYQSTSPVYKNWDKELSLIGADAYDAGFWDPRASYAAGPAAIRFGPASKGISDQHYYGVLKNQGDAWFDQFYDLHSPLGAWVGFDDQVNTATPWADAKAWAKTGAQGGHAGDYSQGGDWGHYAGPSLSGGMDKEKEAPHNRAYRLQSGTGDLEKRWQEPEEGWVDAEGKPTGNDTGDHLYAMDKGQLKDFISTEFGTIPLTPSEYGTYDESPEFQEFGDVRRSRETTFGSTYVPDDFSETEHAFVGADSQSGGLVDHLRQMQSEGLYEHQFDPETGVIDWEATLEGGTAKGAYTDAINQFMGGKKAFQYDENVKGTMLDEFIDKDLGKLEALEEAGTARLDKEQAMISKEQELGTLQEEKSQIGDPIRQGMLEQLIKGRERQYTSGLAGMGPSVQDIGQQNKLLQGGARDMVNKRDAIGLSQRALDTAQSDFAKAKADEDALFKSLEDPWAMLQKRWTDYSGEYGADWAPEKQSYETELWEAITGKF